MFDSTPIRYLAYLTLGPLLVLVSSYAFRPTYEIRLTGLASGERYKLLQVRVGIGLPVQLTNNNPIPGHSIRGALRCRAARRRTTTHRTAADVKFYFRPLQTFSLMMKIVSDD